MFRDLYKKEFQEKDLSKKSIGEGNLWAMGGEYSIDWTSPTNSISLSSQVMAIKTYILQQNALDGLNRKDGPLVNESF